ncbi:4-galactosyl-N-acetylglucosaminide 3-alpha-L-fucosyltransferase 9-like [Cebidichthys violaceus]|uniref:4-galactosyl-N-acetylglucosaminide 3-alpha-L-fucosyltransferase 9-like n=1 Tax=Cebidichthys violaceus TaxID=271503 RepID=UPI0035CBDDE7
MSCSACQWTSLRPFLFGSLVVLCFIGLFITYRSDIKYLDFGKGSQFCPAFLCADKAQIHHPNPKSATKLQNNTHSSPTHDIQTAAVDTEPDTIVLIWMWPFGSRFELDCNIFDIKRCHLTDDKTLYPKAHGVVFHHRDIHGNLDNLPKMPRPSFQKWVWFNMESPANSPRIPGLKKLFNLTCNYRRDSNIQVPYGYLLPVTSEDESFKLPAKDKLVCWIVSNWSEQQKRVQYYNELKKYIKIHVYGNAFGHHLSNDEYPKILSSCKFYLSFENSINKDYITEKLYNPLIMGTVPITLGPPKQTYEEYAPADSFIHVDDFSSPQKLAERLLYLDQNKTEYMQFFAWRSMFKVQRSEFGRSHACKTCKYLQDHKEYQAVNDLISWYWG